MQHELELGMEQILWYDNADVHRLRLHDETNVCIRKIYKYVVGRPSVCVD